MGEDSESSTGLPLGTLECILYKCMLKSVIVDNKNGLEEDNETEPQVPLGSL